MTSKTWTSGTVIDSPWLQDVDNIIYHYTPATSWSAGVGQFLTYVFGRTADEISAAVTPTNYQYFPGDVRRYGADPTGVADSFTAFQSAGSASKKIGLPTGTYKLTAQVTTWTIQHQVLGEGFNRSFLNATHTNAAIYLAPPVSDTQASLFFDQFSITAKYGIQVGGTRASHPTDGAIIGGFIRIRCVGTYSSGSGDAAYDTDKVRDASNSLVSSASGTLAAGAALNTYNDVSSYGVGVLLVKCIDTVVQDPQFYGNGISLALLGCDLIKWRGGRSHEVGLFVYSERIGTWGSQLTMKDVDLLHNHRAGGILLNNTKFDKTTNCYYECYSNSALLINAEQTEGALWDDNRIDDPYYTGGGGTASGTTPLVLLVTPRWNNKLRATRFQKFSSFSTGAPGVRVTGSMTNIDTNHPEAMAIEPMHGYVPIRYMKTAITPFGCRYGTIIRNRYTPYNVPERIVGDIGPLAVLDGTQYVFYNASASTYSVRIPITAMRTAYNLWIMAKPLSGTQIHFTVQHYRYDDSVPGTAPVNNVFIGGFNSGYYSAVSQSFGLISNPQEGDYLVVSWSTTEARVAGIEIPEA